MSRATNGRRDPITNPPHTCARPVSHVTQIQQKQISSWSAAKSLPLPIRLRFAIMGLDVQGLKGQSAKAICFGDYDYGALCMVRPSLASTHASVKWGRFKRFLPNPRCLVGCGLRAVCIESRLSRACPETRSDFRAVPGPDMHDRVAQHVQNA